ncbi:hypothetical protein QVD17_17561 [Tagetes erecta]|uniref:Uncharacterized protein n=1 Tax=Tagetes erecta TaxID=13708 RepID=A0AAD8KT98_TARER|nr:hypothetical protein QVD17_17561 [Tagetes erecta]
MHLRGKNAISFLFYLGHHIPTKIILLKNKKINTPIALSLLKYETFPTFFLFTTPSPPPPILPPAGGSG